MRRFVLALAAVVAMCGAAQAQNIAIGERVPRIKYMKWLKDYAPQKRAYTYIEFIHSKSHPCRLSVEHIAGIAEEFDNINTIIITKEDGAALDGWVERYAGGASGVVILGDHSFDRCGVKYAPFGLLIDHKKRARWFGNPQMLDRKTIEAIVSPTPCAKASKQPKKKIKNNEK